MSEYFSPGDAVIYIPKHAHGDRTHADCERGIVSSHNHALVFVRYYKDGVLQNIGQATCPGDLERATP